MTNFLLRVQKTVAGGIKNLNLKLKDSVHLDEGSHSVDENVKEKRRQRNTELQRRRRANLHTPRRRKTPEDEEAYSAKRRRRNTEIQRLRRQKLRQQQREATTSKPGGTEAATVDDLQATALLTFLQICFSQFQKNSQNGI